ncbi:hypothetical protein M231_07014 [Tremella mesenterica]|uniref:Zn(2)-C6 fungal-type domain-containing protein n=1 Tax=Tremella mesenterica TaxID=5217 RepID=A0A4Q1BEQ3_TREME|nr:hypothetical protein M231_07014 [Tremella mesenterica]
MSKVISIKIAPKYLPYTWVESTYEEHTHVLKTIIRDESGIVLTEIPKRHGSHFKKQVTSNVNIPEITVKLKRGRKPLPTGSSRCSSCVKLKWKCIRDFEGPCGTCITRRKTCEQDWILPVERRAKRRKESSEWKTWKRNQDDKPILMYPPGWIVSNHSVESTAIWDQGDWFDGNQEVET